MDDIKIIHALMQNIHEEKVDIMDMDTLNRNMKMSHGRVQNENTHLFIHSYVSTMHMYIHVEECVCDRCIYVI